MDDQQRQGFAAMPAAYGYGGVALERAVLASRVGDAGSASRAEA